LGDGTSTQRLVPVKYNLNENVTQISAGLYTTIVVTNKGIVYASGSNSKGQLGLGTNSVQYFPLPLALENIVQVICHTEFSSALRSDGALYS
jgi:alpha-tubulin suppressor-like RCC1 family protein